MSLVSRLFSMIPIGVTLLLVVIIGTSGSWYNNVYTLSDTDESFVTHRGVVYPLDNELEPKVIAEGKYSSWEKTQAGLMVARDKTTYNRICRFINNNTRNEMYEFTQFDSAHVYIFVFAPWADYEPGWSLAVNSLEKNKNDSLLFEVKARAVDAKVGNKSSPTNAWKMVKVPTVIITKDTRFQLSIHMDRTETILPTEMK